MPEWTSEQKNAIENWGGSLLVSAAAGSGKTAVLTERVLRRVTDPENPIDITQLLLVTFTKAAASEMRERIAAAIASAVRRSRVRPVCGVSSFSCTARKSRPCIRCVCRLPASRRHLSASRPTSA